MSRYTEPRKFNGTDSWNNKPFTITKSPTVIVPDKERRKKLRPQIALLWTVKQQKPFPEALAILVTQFNSPRNLKSITRETVCYYLISEGLLSQRKNWKFTRQERSRDFTLLLVLTMPIMSFAMGTEPITKKHHNCFFFFLEKCWIQTIFFFILTSP